MLMSKMGGNLLNGYIGGHGVLLTLKSRTNPEYTIKFTAATLHTKGINVSNEFGWDDIESDSSKLGYTISDKQAPNTFRKQKFNPSNSTTHISLDGVIGPFMYLMLDKLIMRQAQPFDTLKLLRVLGLRGVMFKAYGGNDTCSINPTNDYYEDYGVWVLKALSWDESDFQYASSAAKIEFSAKFAVNINSKQYERDEKTQSFIPDAMQSKYPPKTWS